MERAPAIGGRLRVAAGVSSISPGVPVIVVAPCLDRNWMPGTHSHAPFFAPQRMKRIESAVHRTQLAATRFTVATIFCACLLSIPGVSRAQTVVRDVDRPTRQPFQTGLVNQIVGESPRLFTLAEVPLGKHLVIEHVSVQFSVTRTPASLVNIFLRTQVNGEPTDHVLVLDKKHELPANTADIFQASQTIRAYADPGTTVSALFSFHTGSRSDGVDKGVINRLSLSGYFVDER
jgi:hypothetical protein